MTAIEDTNAKEIEQLSCELLSPVNPKMCKILLQISCISTLPLCLLSALHQ